MKIIGPYAVRPGGRKWAFPPSKGSPFEKGQPFERGSTAQ